MSIDTLVTLLSITKNKKYAEKDVKSCLIKTSKKTGERPNVILNEMIDSLTKDVNFFVILEYKDSKFRLKTIDNAINKMKTLALEDGIKKTRKFVFSFKSFMPKRLREYKHLNYEFSKNKTSTVTVFIRPIDYGSKKYEIRYPVGSYRSKTLRDLLSDTSGIIQIIKYRHFTSTNPEYDDDREGYDPYLDELGGF